jgi:tRNA nucleotidyltransferase (CCA-adding enzyme)
MIKLPDEIARIIETIEGAGYEAYAVGGCVRDSILGRRPEDWDLAGNAPRDRLEALFPGAQVVNRKLGVLRLFSEGFTADIAAFRIDGEYRDFRRPENVVFTQDINEDLKRRDFTMNAIAVSPVRGTADPCGGVGDIRKRLIRGIGNPRLRFEEDALRILRAVRFAAQLEFEIDGETFRAMGETATLLSHISTERIREEFTKTIVARGAGKGIALCMEAGLLPYLLGEECAKALTGEELEKLTDLTARISRSAPEPAFRLALFYQCFEESRALCAIDRLSYSNAMKKRLQYAVSLSGKLEQIRDKPSLKGFLCQLGPVHYRYLEELAEQRNTVFPGGEEPFRHRAGLLREIRDNGEPVFMKELAINGQDLKGLGIAEGAEIGRLLARLLATVHRFPEQNGKCQLLGLAESLRLTH